MSGLANCMVEQQISVTFSLPTRLYAEIQQVVFPGCLRLDGITNQAHPYLQGRAVITHLDTVCKDATRPGKGIGRLFNLNDTAEVTSVHSANQGMQCVRISNHQSGAKDTARVPVWPCR